MSGGEIALDTNQAIAVLNNTGDAGQWVQMFSEVWLPVPVIGELCFGALNSQHPMENLQRVEYLVARSKILELTASTARTYAHIRLSLKQRGRPIPENDVWIAAVCMERNVPLATSDRHFLDVVGLKVIGR